MTETILIGILGAAVGVGFLLLVSALLKSRAEAATLWGQVAEQEQGMLRLQQAKTAAETELGFLKTTFTSLVSNPIQATLNQHQFEHLVHFLQAQLEFHQNHNEAGTDKRPN